MLNIFDADSDIIRAWSEGKYKPRAVPASWPLFVTDAIARAIDEHRGVCPRGEIELSETRDVVSRDVIVRLSCRQCNSARDVRVSQEALVQAQTYTSDRTVSDFKPWDDGAPWNDPAPSLKKLDVGPPLRLPIKKKQELPIAEPPRRAAPSDDGV